MGTNVHSNLFICYYFRMIHCVRGDELGKLCELFVYVITLTIRTAESRRLRWAGHVARTGLSRNAYRVLVGRAEGKKHLGRPRRR